MSKQPGILAYSTAPCETFQPGLLLNIQIQENLLSPSFVGQHDALELGCLIGMKGALLELADRPLSHRSLPDELLHGQVRRYIETYGLPLLIRHTPTQMTANRE